MDYDSCKESADYIQQRAPIMPQLGIICGSGLGKAVFYRLLQQRAKGLILQVEFLEG